MQGWPLESANRIAVVPGRLGSITLYDLGDPVAVLVIAHGAISLRMIRREVRLVAEFADDHPQGWCYLGDVRRVRFLNPLNLVVLQHIRRLPGVRRRIVVVPRLVQWLEPLAIGDLTRSVEDALDRCRAH